MMNRIIIGSGPILGAAAVIKNEEPKKDEKKQETTPKVDKIQFVCRPSELPIYGSLYEQNQVKKVVHPSEPKNPSTLEQGIHSVRVEVTNAIGSLSSHKKTVEEFIDNGKRQSVVVVDYLNQPDNTAPRAGAIALGGLSGYIVGLRGGFFRRSFYGTIGAGIIASICYPKLAAEYGQVALVEGKKYATIGYNFAYGVKPGDDAPAPNWPKIPTTLGELSDSITGMAKSAINAVVPDKK